MMGMPFLDPLAGFVVAGMIGHVGVQAARDALWELTDGAVGEKTMVNIRGTVVGVEGVESVHRLRGRQMGPYLMVDMVVGVDPWLSISAAHAIGRKVSDEIREHHHKVIEVLVHTAPADAVLEAELEVARERGERGGVTPSERLRVKVEERVRGKVGALPELQGSMQVVHLTTHILRDGIHMHIVLEVRDPGMTVTAATHGAKRVRMAVEEIEGVVEADVHLELEGRAATEGL